MSPTECFSLRAPYSQSNKNVTKEEHPHKIWVKIQIPPTSFYFYLSIFFQSPCQACATFHCSFHFLPKSSLQVSNSERIFFSSANHSALVAVIPNCWGFFTHHCFIRRFLPLLFSFFLIFVFKIPVPASRVQPFTIPHLSQHRKTTQHAGSFS